MSVLHLEILTPQRQFFDEDVEAITVSTTDGELTVLRGHAAISLPLVIGKILIKQNGSWREAFQSEGFLEVDEDGAHVFVQACEWPEDIDASRAREAAHRAQERLRQQQSRSEYEWSRVSLARAMMRLRITHSRTDSDQ